ncbi:MAG: glycosyltransferase [Flavipsychrobacter sp.]
MKRIALVGNMNNNFFAITRYLRDKGYDAHLFYRLATPHFQPMADSYGNDYESFCHQVDWLENGFHNADVEDVRKVLNGFEFYIGQGEEAAVAYKAGFNIDVYYPYGSDVYKYAQLPQEYALKSKIKSLLTGSTDRPSYSQMKEGTMAKYLKGAIIDARYIFADATNDEFEAQLKSLQYKGIYKKVPMPFIYYPEYERIDEKALPQYLVEKIRQIKTSYDFVLLYHGRQEWATYHNQFTGKNTHHLIQGFAGFIKENPQCNACLVMLEYGTDVEQSKKLIYQLGIEDIVYWLPKMYRKELMYVVQQANVCCGEFAHSFLTFGTVVEAMLMKKPVITHRVDSYYASTYPVLYPCYNAREPKEIEQAISQAFTNPEERLRMGDEAYAWVKKNFIENPLQELLNIIEA